MINEHINNLDRFKQAISDIGLIPPEQVITDGKIHRFGQLGDDGIPCWYLYHDNIDISVAVFGCWKRNVSEKWCSKSFSSLSPQEKKSYREQVSGMIKLAENERQQSQKAAAKICKERWQTAQPISPQHPYVARKKIRPYGIKQEGNCLLIPIVNAENELVNLQTIAPNGDKRFAKDAQKKGCFSILGNPEDKIYICEGYATAVTIHELTKKATIIAFDAGNILPVTKNIKELYPNGHVIIAADNDHLNETNTGLNKAKEAAATLHCDYVYPLFDEDQKGSDFNDLFILKGASFTLNQINNIHTSVALPISDRLKKIDLFDGDKQKSASTLLIEIGCLFGLFHDEDRNGYAIVSNGTIKQVIRLRSEEFKEHLSNYYYTIKQKGAHTNALQDALNTLEAKAKFSGECHKVFRRVGHQDGKIYIDLVNENWEVVEIDSSGWRILKESPVMFIRGKYSKAMPTPTTGGNLNQLWQYINVKELDKALIFGWLMGAFKPQGPYPLLSINGIQGSGKTFLTRVLRTIVDPNTADTSNAPRDERDFAAQAYNNWLICLDNLSNIDNWLSDALCRMSTGGGISSRRLYSDVEEVVYEISRPGIVNGIPDLATRADLRERCISIELEPLGETKRESDAKLMQSFKNDLPKILGAIFGLLSSAIRKKSNIKLERKPRLAEFSEWVVAAEQGANLPAQFLEAYFENLQNSDEDAAEVSVIVYALQILMKENRTWIGTISELFKHLNRLDGITDEMKRSKAWRDSALKMRNEIKRNITTLRTVGIGIILKYERAPGTGDRLMKIERLESLPDKPSQPSQLSQKSNLNSENIKLGRDNSNNYNRMIPSQKASQSSYRDTIVTIPR